MLRFAHDSQATRRLALAVQATLLGAFGTAAVAQEGAQQEIVGLETIVVTAQKKAENLQEVPISVAAVTSGDLEDLAAARLDGLSGTVPNVQIGYFSNTPNTAAVYIRGIGTFEPDPYAGNTVSIVTDGVPQFFSMGALLDLADVQRIEVLRGPQGTLFGANTTGGVVNVVNNQPTQEFGGKLEVNRGNWNRNIVAATINGGLTDTISGRLTIRNDQRDGWVEDVIDGHSIGDRNVSIFRGALKFEPTDNFDATITGEYDRARNGSPVVVGGNRPGNAALGIPADVEFVPAGWNNMYVSPCPPDGGRCKAPDKYLSAQNNGPADASGERVPDQSDMDTYYGNLTMSWRNTPIGDVTSITGYKKFRLFEYTDQDGTPAFLIDTRRRTRGWQLSQELRTSFKPTDRLEVIAGGFFMKTHYDHFQKLRIDFGGGATYDLTNNTTTKGFPGLYQLNLQDQDNWSGSLFAQTYFKVTDKLRFQAGLRYTHEKTEMLASTATSFSTSGAVSFDGQPIGTGAMVSLGTSAPPKGSKGWDKVGWKVGLDYQFGDNQMVYATWARGFKSGGFSGRIGLPQDIGPYEPETVDTYEIGMKADFMDNRLRTNVAAFYTDYKDLQLAQIYFVGTLQGNTILNVGSAKIKGVEFELTAVPVDGLTLNATAAYLDATYDNFIFKTTNYAAPGAIRTLDMSGKPMQNAPKWTTAVSAEYIFPVGPGDARVNLQYTYQGEKLLGSIEDVQRSRVQPMSYVNANIDYKPAGTNLTFGLWARNLFDKRYIANVLDLPGTLGLTQYAPPREYGASIKYEF
jgi:iron complex outermembrane receptor protein